MVVGVPEIAPLVVEKERPAGNEGEIDHVETGPPLEVGVAGAVIATPFTNVIELGLYVIDDGGAMLTWMVTTAVALPPLFVAVIV